MTRLSRLEIQVRTYDEAYRAGRPLVTDQEYDVLRDQLKRKNPNSPVLVETGSGSHLQSLDNGSFLDWQRKIGKTTQLLIQPKIDGCAVAARYIDGRLVKAWTRSGKDITAAMRLVDDFPQELTEAVDIEIRGELFGVGLSGANSQRLAAGHIRKKVPTTNKQLSFAAFQIFGFDVFGFEDRVMCRLEDLGFKNIASRLLRVGKDEAPMIKRMFSQWEDSLLWPQYPTDGLVVKVNDQELQAKLDKQAKTAPLWAFAIKNWS